jgi:hypothetical protein
MKIEEIVLTVRNALIAASTRITPVEALAHDGDSEVCLGEFATEEEAAHAYDIACIMCGQTAVNFPSFPYHAVFRKMRLMGILGEDVQ